MKYVAGHKAGGPPQLCECGCGRMTKPGNKVILGHAKAAALKRKKAAAQGGLFAARVQHDLNIEERFGRQRIVSRCLHCDFVAEGRANETAAAFKEHKCAKVAA